VIHYLFAANRSEKAGQIAWLLARGVNVVCDRYFLSGEVYSLAQGLDKEFCSSTSVGLPKPDVTFLLNSTRQPKTNPECFEDKGFQDLVRKQYELLIDFNELVVIDCDKAFEVVAEEINTILLTKVFSK